MHMVMRWCLQMLVGMVLLLLKRGLGRMLLLLLWLLRRVLLLLLVLGVRRGR